MNPRISPRVGLRFLLGLFLMVGAAKAQSGGKGRDQSPRLREANEHVRAGRPIEALAAVRAELAVSPNSAGGANLLDVLGASKEAREVFQRRIETASDPAARAMAQRAMAMSYAFDGDCANVVKYEREVMAYWRTQEKADPQNAFYQQGEMANEAARVCIDRGDLVRAEELYRLGTELGLKEPEPKTHPASLWHFRLAHALARLAARRGDAVEAKRHLVAARAILDSDPSMAAQQERFFPYLTGYVALYLGDLAKAKEDLTRAVAVQGNQNDPFFTCLLAMTEEKLGNKDRATELFRKAYGQATAHNPPAAFVRPFARQKLGL